jgi:hypothetical protein
VHTIGPTRQPYLGRISLRNQREADIEQALGLASTVPGYGERTLEGLPHLVCIAALRVPYGADFISRRRQ